MTPTDTEGLLRDAGGARPRDELDALIERLRSVSCILTPECDEHKTVREAAAALVQLRERVAALEAERDALHADAVAIFEWMNRKGGMGLDVHRRIDTFLATWSKP